MHILKKEPAQRTAGYITAVVPDLNLVRSRLSEVAEVLTGSQFRCRLQALSVPD